VGAVDLVVLLLVISLTGLIVGALARLAVPGPDPMPWWQTILLGVAGSILGALVAGWLGIGASANAEDALTGFLVQLAGATILLVLYRKLVQGRPITGPDARRRP
jgi:uncharacterized membrane protein YeaQ/YmgE (transglycosylase-associated protein family)